MKKKCEICGKIKPQEDFSKSYRNRCKECVAQQTREIRQSAKQHFADSPHQKHESIFKDVVVAESKRSERLWVAAYALQGMLSNRKLDGILIGAANLASDAVRFADAIIAEIDKEGGDK